MKTIVSVVGIRPDFIRMSEIFRKLDESFNHILIHTGQHFDEILSDVFFNDLKIREPEYNLGIGGKDKKHFHQTGELSIKLINLLKEQNINPDLIIFLGDSNTVLVSSVLKKEGYKIAHIEAGMRSRDKRMLEEINRTVCDHCSDIHFVYHENYKENLIKENLPEKNIYIVGNTIIEPANKIKKEKLTGINFPVKTNMKILVDIHRPENFKYKNRLENLFSYIIFISNALLPVNCEIKMLSFNRTLKAINDFKLYIPPNVKFVPMMSYVDYLKEQIESFFIISDSGTAQEEPGLFKTPVIVPRDYTERPESVVYNCSYMININSKYNFSWERSKQYIEEYTQYKTVPNIKWLGEGNTSHKIVEILKSIL